MAKLIKTEAEMKLDAPKSFYVATKEGFDGMQIRKPGDIFAFSGKKGSWMREASAEEAHIVEHMDLDPALDGISEE